MILFLQEREFKKMLDIRIGIIFIGSNAEDFLSLILCWLQIQLFHSYTSENSFYYTHDYCSLMTCPLGWLPVELNHSRHAYNEKHENAIMFFSSRRLKGRQMFRRTKRSYHIYLMDNPLLLPLIRWCACQASMAYVLSDATSNWQMTVHCLFPMPVVFLCPVQKYGVYASYIDVIQWNILVKYALFNAS